MIAMESFETVDLRDICDSNEAFGRLFTICCEKVGENDAEGGKRVHQNALHMAKLHQVSPKGKHAIV